MPPAMSLKLFGIPQLAADALPVRLSSTRAYHILARIAFARGTVVDRRAIIQGVWPELDTEAAFAALRRELYRIETAWRDAGNATPLMLRDRRFLGFDPAAMLDVDVLRFEEQCASGKLAEAAATYTADLFDTNDDPVIDRERERLAIRIADVLERLVVQARLEGRFADAIAYAIRLQTLDPYHEQTIRTLMQLRGEAGDRGAAIATYRAFEALIAAELGAKPLPATMALSRKLADVEIAGAIGRKSLPVEHASLIGRERDVAAVSALFERNRLITLTGPPGIGKSRLATRIAWLRESDFADGAFFVDLTNASKPGDVERTLLETFRGQSQDAAKSSDAFLAGRSAFVVIDNCEHVLAECVTAIGRMLAVAPDAKFLATSRRPLHLSAEAEWRLNPLALPAHGVDDSDAVLAPAVRLFLERAERVRPSQGDAPPVVTTVSICALLDGVPLALELAASRLRLTTFAELEALLLARVPILSTAFRGEQPPTREAPYAWSYALLSECGRAAFRRLAVFAGGFTLEAARAVCADLGVTEAFEALAELVEHSMIVVAPLDERGSRYKLLFSAHEFAAAMLSDIGEAAAARATHARYYLALASTLAHDAMGSQRERSYPKLHAESTNIAAALEEAIVRDLDVEAGLRTCIALARYWTDAFQNREGLALIEAALHRTAPSSPIAPKALEVASVLARQSGDIARAIGYAESACAKFAQAGDELQEARALTSLGNAYTIVGNLDRALAAGLKALAIAQRLGSEEVELVALCMVAQVNLSSGDVREARTRFARALDLSVPTKLVREGLVSLNNLAVCALLENDPVRAEHYAASALESGRTLMLPENVAWALSVLASVAWKRGDVRVALALSDEVVTAARMTGARILEIRLLEDIASYLMVRDEPASCAKLLGAGDAARKHFDQPVQPIEEPPRAEIDAAAVLRIGATGFEAARSIGTTWSIESAVTRALAYARDLAGGLVASIPPSRVAGTG